MAYNYNEYMKKYNKEKMVTVSVKLHREHDADIIALLENTNKSATIKTYIRKAIGTYYKKQR